MQDPGPGQTQMFQALQERCKMLELQVANMVTEHNFMKYTIYFLQNH